MDTYPKACVILGAGASHDVKGEASPYIESGFRPPLAKELFDIENHPVYWEIIDKYPGAKVLAQSLAPLISSGQVSVEKELRRCAEHHDPRIRSQFKYIPAYLRDLLHSASYKYTEMPSSYIELAKELLAEHPHDVLFIILNYDNLLEQALQWFEPRLKFDNISDYVAVNRPAKVVKLHGSINWFRTMHRDDRESWDSALARFDPSIKPSENEIIVTNWSRPIRDYGDFHPQQVYPILTAPLAGKGVSDAVCPDSHAEVAKEFLRDCQKFLIVGTSGLDEDLLTMVDSALIDPMIYRHIHIVNSGAGADEARKKLERGIKVFGANIDVRHIFREGFRKYLRDGLKSFSEFAM
jgi:hypothetical protein